MSASWQIKGAGKETNPDTEAGLGDVAATGAAGQLPVAAGQLPDDALLQLCASIPLKEGLQRAAAAAVAADVQQLSWRQISDALRKVRARLLLKNGRSHITGLLPS